jgi:hypothetical protein
MSDLWQEKVFNNFIETHSEMDCETKVKVIKEEIKKTKYFPIRREHLLELYKVWNVSSWIKNKQDLLQGTVKIKSIEQVLKDGSNLDLDITPEFNSEYTHLKEVYHKCKDWLVDFKKVNEDYATSERRG